MLGLGRFCVLFHIRVFCKGKTNCSIIMCMYVHFAWKGHPRNDLYCVGWDVKPYTLTHSLRMLTQLRRWSREYSKRSQNCNFQNTSAQDCKSV